MKLSKFLSIATFITCLSLVYVCQQTEIFRLAYIGQKKLFVYQDLLDKNSFLRYNVYRNASLVYIGSKMAGYSGFQMPDTYRFVKLAPSGEGLKLTQQPPAKETLLSRLFGIKRQAEAKTINP